MFSTSLLFDIGYTDSLASDLTAMKLGHHGNSFAKIMFIKDMY
jgi:hypothetical protein